MMTMLSLGVMLITDTVREMYMRDGAVCLRNVISRDTAAQLLAVWDDAAADLAAHRLETTSRERKRITPGASAVKHVSRALSPFSAFVADTDIPAWVGDLVGAHSVGFYWDQMFVKEPGTQGKTPWHCDASGHPLKGSQIVGVWIALTDVVPENGLECLAGSHRYDEDYWPATAAGDLNPPPPGRRRCPDFEERRDDPSLTFLSWSMAPGDALFIHPRTLHFSRGNTTADKRRVAYATWWHGDDVVWDARPECESLPPGVTAETAVSGCRPDAPACPILWRRPAAPGAAHA